MPVAAAAADDALGHLGDIGVRTAVDVVMQVVELDHPGIACLEHLDVGHRRDRLDVVWGQAIEKAVHHLAPGPETVLGGAGALGEPRHAALERMAVQVRHARQGDRTIATRCATRCDRHDPLTSGRQPQTFLATNAEKPKGPHADADLHQRSDRNDGPGATGARHHRERCDPLRRRRHHHLGRTGRRSAGERRNRARPRRPPDDARADRLPHAPGMGRQSRRRIRDAARRTHLCRDRPGRRRHRLDRQGDARCRRGRSGGARRRAGTGADGGRRHDRRGEVRLWPRHCQRGEAAARRQGLAGGAVRAPRCRHHLSRGARPAAGGQRRQGPLHRPRHA